MALTQKQMETVGYDNSKDGKGLVKFLRDIDTNEIASYHVHADEMTALERWIKNLIEDIDETFQKYMGRKK